MKSTLEIERTTLEHWKQRAIRSERKCADLEVSVLGSTGRVAKLEAEVGRLEKDKEDLLTAAKANVSCIPCPINDRCPGFDNCFQLAIRRANVAEARLEEVIAVIEEAAVVISDVKETVMRPIDCEQPHYMREEIKTLRARVTELEAEVERRRTERKELLNVKSTEGLLASEWLVRTGRAEARADATEARLEKVRAICDEKWMDRKEKKSDAQTWVFGKVQRIRALLDGEGGEGA